MTIRYRVELLQEALSTLCERVNGIDQAVLVSLDGFVAASYPPAADLQVDSPLHSPNIAATAANAIALGNGALDRLAHGELERLIIEGQNGAMIIHPIPGAEAALVTLVDKDTKMGLASLAMRKLIAELATILTGGSNNSA